MNLVVQHTLDFIAYSFGAKSANVQFLCGFADFLFLFHYPICSTKYPSLTP